MSSSSSSPSALRQAQDQQADNDMRYHFDQPLIVQVAVPLPLRRKTPLVYDYLFDVLDDDQPISPQIGMIVQVPLGKRLVWGIILACEASQQEKRPHLKAIEMIADGPVLTAHHVRFLRAVADWTLAPFGMVMRMMLSTPAALLPPPLQSVYHLPPVHEDDQETDHRRAPKHLTEKRKRILSFLADGPALTASDLAAETGTSVAIVKAMAKQGLLQESQVPKPAPVKAAHHDALLVTLTGAQKKVADGLLSYLGQGYSAHLLDGVTGSGKTEVYFELVHAALATSSQILILLPEIALTTAWQDRFVARFGRKPHIWHSSVSQSERRHIWRSCLAGEPMVVVGARSALFLPFTNLGMIIIDEEHEQAFKQEDMVIYQARDMAVMRAYIEAVPVIMATATPSLESWVNAGHLPEAATGSSQKITHSGRYHHWRLQDRAGGAHLPDITMVDLKQDRPPAGRWLSDPLIKAIAQNLEKQQQSLLFLNRRGYAPLSICESCGEKATCEACDSWLVTHRLTGTRQCHHCGYRQKLVNHCHSCGAEETMRAYGPGVERLAEEVTNMFPDARICIFSSDTAARPEVASQMITAITSGEIDIIIGTQMAAKGHHFPNLTLVGVVDADFGLQGGDLRAAERTYQMLSQAAGRAGREAIKGQAMLQSYEPDNKVFQSLASGDRDSFLATEVELRQAALMPPFGKLAAVILSGPDEKEIEQMAWHIAGTKPQFQQVDIFGPTAAPIARIRGRYRMRFLLRAPKDVDLQTIIRQWLDEIRLPARMQLQIDIDPYNFL